MPNGVSLLNFSQNRLGKEVLINPDFANGYTGWALDTGFKYFPLFSKIYFQKDFRDLVTNGTFPANLASWNLTQGTITWSSGNGGQMQMQFNGAIVAVTSQNVALVPVDIYGTPVSQVRFKYTIRDATMQNARLIGAEPGGTNNDAPGSYSRVLATVPAAILTASFQGPTISTDTLHLDDVSVEVLIDESRNLSQQLLVTPGIWRLAVEITRVDLAGGIVRLNNNGTLLVNSSILSPGTYYYDIFIPHQSVLIQIGRDSGGGNIEFEKVSLRPYLAASPSAETVVIDQANIQSDSYVEAWMEGDSTADHSPDEHLIEPIKLTCGNIVPGVGFTIYGETKFGTTLGEYKIRWIWF